MHTHSLATMRTRTHARGHAPSPRCARTHARGHAPSRRRPCSARSSTRFRPPLHSSTLRVPLQSPSSTRPVPVGTTSARRCGCVSARGISERTRALRAPRRTAAAQALRAHAGRARARTAARRRVLVSAHLKLIGPRSSRSTCRAWRRPVAVRNASADRQFSPKP
jgi:hypothetical protein